MKYLYLVDYWVPFPSSEYGGVVSVVAENDNECHDVLLEWRDLYEDAHDSRIMENVSKSLRFALDAIHGDEESRVVDSFTT
jgi:hypothetical protein